MNIARLTVRLLLLLVMVVAIAACESAEEAEPAADSGDTAADTTSDTDTDLVIAEPVDGTTVDTEEVTVSGMAPPDAVVRFEKVGPDESIEPDPDGNWSYSVDLDEGENELAFHLARIIHERSVRIASRRQSG